MTLAFVQRRLPKGVLHLLIDDGEKVLHVFQEAAPWRQVASAAGQGTSLYTEAVWQRRAVAEEAPERT
jgi:hypothetical protein